MAKELKKPKGTYQLKKLKGSKKERTTPRITRGGAFFFLKWR